MAINIDTEIKQICDDLTRLIQDEIRKQKLISTGKMLNSIRFVGKKVPSGINFQMESVDYFAILDDKYKISENAFKTMDFQRIQERIADITVNQLLGDLDI